MNIKTYKLCSLTVALLLANSSVSAQVVIDQVDQTLDNDMLIESTDTAIDVIAGGDNAIINNEATGVVDGDINGIRFAEGVDGGTVNNQGTITSDSRAVDIQGDNITINNEAAIATTPSTGSARNGVVYTNVTAQGTVINNMDDGSIDAGEGNTGAAISAELDSNGTQLDIDNSGTIQGRGQADAGAATAGDGIRLERTRVGGALDGSTAGTFTGTITNSGTINSESTQGTTAGIRAVNGVSFQGTINNTAGGTISGTQNGLYLGNATPAGGGQHTGTVNNAGTISSDSRAVNIDGSGLTIVNEAGGQIIGTGNQRNGTVYADATAQDFLLDNDGVIDAGVGNDGAGFSVELSEAGNSFEIDNSGTIQGRGQADAGAATAGDGIRLERTRVGGALDGSTAGTFTGTITNSGTINSESTQGTTAGIRAVNGVSFQGTINNTAGGTISGTQNGLYLGNATPAGGGQHTGTVNNAGTISSDSRAVNIDGSGLTIVNEAGGQIIGTGNQRNGTVYADSTANKTLKFIMMA